MLNRRLYGIWLVVGVLAIAIISGAVTVFSRYLRAVPSEPLSDSLEHFKYGSIGAEVNGLPYEVWRVLPALYPDVMPNGWSDFGFLYEADRELPIGISVRQYMVDRIGFNCATCHTSRVEGQSDILLGAPAESLKLQDYLRFLSSLGNDPKFATGSVLAAMKEANPSFDLLDEIVYGSIIIPRIKEELARVADNSEWMDRRPAHGPGRTDAGNPWRFRFGLEPQNDDIVGTTDFPHIWMQIHRVDGWAHWDGNNSSLSERNLSAALAGGATEESLDHVAIETVAAWSMSAPPPIYPAAIDSVSALEGQQIFLAECAQCHALAASGATIELSEIGSDPDRHSVFSSELLDMFSTVGEGTSWQFSNYSPSVGYVAVPMDGIWARGPYLHNGSVPTVADLLNPPADRPETFYRGCTRLDLVRLGFDCKSGFLLDTSVRGNSNSGHEYGTDLTQSQKTDLIEYLKTL